MARHLDCSIITLAHNGRAYTEHFLTNLLAASVLPRQVILVDNGSSDSTPELLAAALPRLQAAGIAGLTWRNAENLGCSLARNMAWERAEGEFVLFMDNDTAIRTHDWLARLVARMQAEPRLGVLGPKLLYPFVPHRIQCAGVAINRLGRVRFRGRGEPHDTPAYSQYEVVPALISACWIMRNGLRQEVGGLDPLFHPVQFEDLDFCLRVNQAGYHCGYTPEVEIYHFEGRTTGSFGRQNYTRNIVEQSVKFRQRWREVLKNYPDDPVPYRWLEDHELGLRDELDLTLANSPTA